LGSALWSKARPGLWAALVHVLALAGLCQQTMAQEGVYRWRTLTTDGRSFLNQADSDATDAVGRIGLSCTDGSGNVEVAVTMSDEQRAEFAEILRSGRYPDVALSGDGEGGGSVIDALKMTDDSGWLYTFSVSADAKWLADFEATGTMRFVVGKTIRDGGSLKVGLDAISDFRSRCRKKPQSPPPAPQSSLPWTRPDPNAFPPVTMPPAESRE
jgi:hypothetical protein